MKKIIFFSLGILILVSLSGCFGGNNSKNATADLTFYGLDDSDVWTSLIAEYRKTRPNIRIQYKKFNNRAEFENLLVNEIAEGEGPDVFYIQNTWLPRHTKKLVPLVNEKFTPQQYGETFVSVTADDFIQPDPRDGKTKIYAAPLFVDTLALYYNKEHFEKILPEKGKPAGTWDQMANNAAAFRVQTADGRLDRGIIALGRGDTIKLAPDILYNFFLQSGAEFYDSDFKKVQIASSGKDVFEDFVSYGLPQNKNYSYGLDSAVPPNSEVEAFLSGKVSAIAGYSDLYGRLEQEIKNVKSKTSSAISFSDIGVAPMPQMTADETQFRVWADYNGLAVSRNTKYSNTAWDFILFLTSKKSAAEFHKKTKRPTARRDLIEEQKKEPITDVFVSQVGYAGSFRLYSEQKFGEILREAIQKAVSGQSTGDALNGADREMNAILEVEAPDGLYPKVKQTKK